MPDFAAANAEVNLIIETKAVKDMRNADVKAKAEAAAVWCKNASEYAHTTNGKPWRYLLVPHDAVAQNMTLKALVDQYSMK